MTTYPRSGNSVSTCSPAQMRALMATFPTGVSVVTAMAADGTPRGMTCSALCSVTLTPPTLLICLQSESRTLWAIRASGMFAVNLLHAEARATAQLFAAGPADRFDRVRWHADPDSAGPHLPQDAHTIGDCRVVDVQLFGDHTVVFGEVVRVTHRQPQPPLLYGLRHYSTWQAP